MGMICLIALVAFGILGIFSAKYRELSKEAFNCVFRRITLRKCETGFDKRMKAKITGKLMTKSPKAAGFVLRNFEAISWTLTILMIVSIFYSAQGIYYYAAYGNCNGKTGGFCIFNSIAGDAKDTLMPDIPIDKFPAIGPENASVQVVEFGCFQCPYTKAAEPTVNKILKEYDGKVRFVFVFSPIPHHYNALRAAEAAVCAERQGEFAEYRQLLFENQNAFNNSVSPDAAIGVFESLAGKTQINSSDFDSCLTSSSAAGEVQQSVEYALEQGIKQTPTFYVNGKKIQGVISGSNIEDALNSR